MESTQLAKVVDARCELGAAVRQALPSDDKIIVGHMRRAEELLSEVIREANEQRRVSTRAPEPPIVGQMRRAEELLHEVIDQRRASLTAAAPTAAQNIVEALIEAMRTEGFGVTTTARRT